MKLFQSNKVTRTANRINAGAEVAGSALSSISPIAKLPTKATQAVTAAITLFHPKTKTTERVLLGIQLALAVTQIGLIAALTFKGDKCQDGSAECNALLICELLYQGLLVAALGAGEVIREPYANNDRQLDMDNP